MLDFNKLFERIKTEFPKAKFKYGKIIELNDEYENVIELREEGKYFICDSACEECKWCDNEIEVLIELGIPLELEDIVPKNKDSLCLEKDSFDFDRIEVDRDGFMGVMIWDDSYYNKNWFKDPTFIRQYKIIKELNGYGDYND